MQKLENSLVIHQPDFAPYIGFFNRLIYVDNFVILDHVNFNKRGWTHRDKIKCQNQPVWLSVPITKSTKDGPINEVCIDHSSNWVKDHLKRIKGCYQKAIFFDEIYPIIENHYTRKVKKLSDFNKGIIITIIELLEININLVHSSDYELNSTSNHLMIDICKKLKCDNYLSGLGAKNYMIPELFTKENINIVWQEFKPREYKQVTGEFIENLSIFDTLFNCGVAETKELIK